MSAPLLSPTPSYPDLLRTAYRWGRVDGFRAADLEPLEGADISSTSSRGCDPAGFARRLWTVPDAPPPAGLAVNAPHWYAHGFQEALAEVRAGRAGSQSRLRPGRVQPARGQPETEHRSAAQRTHV
jgi:hypothetical protein